MAALTAAAVLSIAAACAPSVDAHTLAGIAQHESGLQPYAIHDNTTGRSVFPDGKAEAVTTANALIAKGHSVDLGLMQVNRGNFAWLGLTVDTAFDPCASVAAGAKVLTGLSAYNTGSPTRGIAYAGAVLNAERRVKGEASAPLPSSDPSTPQPELYAIPADARELDFN